MRNFLWIGFCLFLIARSSAQCSHRHVYSQRDVSLYDDPGNARSDSFDVVLTVIDLDMTLMNQSILKAACSIDVIPAAEGIDRILFDLAESLTVDSVHVNDEPNPFTRNGFHIHIPLESSLQTTSPCSVRIFYQGDPPTDNSFGGFYHVPGYGFNLGVGFHTDPHNYGRAWFPCFDNFVERSAHEVRVLTNNGRTAYCGGLRTSVQTAGQDSLLTTWVLTEPVPSYLVSVAVSQYTHVEWEYTKLNGEEIPVYLAAHPADTTNFKNSMSTLLQWLEGSEEYFGEYRWPRAGYVAVPFGGGAMEHATNIAYPLFAIDGSLTYETLMAHELSHHWWGDLITCSTAEDMWLNEGWASFCEALYMEYMYGHEAYMDYVMSNHKNVLTHAHLDDGGRYPVSGVPHEQVYGTHVYSKGASIVHNLRGMLGDESFFAACTGFLDTFAFTPVSSEDLKNFFQGYTMLDLTPVFQQWIYSPGYPEFRIRSWHEDDNGVHVKIDQFRHYADEYYDQVPLKITLLDPGGNRYDETIIMDGQINEVSIVSPENWEETGMVLLNYDNDLVMAVLPETKVIYTPGSSSFNYAEFILQTEDMGGNDSLFVRIENHWAAAADPNNIPGTDFILSNDRWWNVDGFFEGASLNGTIRFYGNPVTSGYYDPLFFGALQDGPYTENDLKIFYRPNGSEPWTVWPDFIVETLGGATNWNGRFQVYGLQKGQYCWGIQTGTVSSGEQKPNVQSVSVYTDPQQQLHLLTANEKGVFSIYDIQGKIIEQITVQRGHHTVPMQFRAGGTYLVVYQFEDHVKTFHITKHGR